MRKPKHTGNFLLCLLINLIMNIEWAIPGIILLVLHFWVELSLLFAISAFIIWIAVIIIWMLIMGWARKCSDAPDIPKENKNPYSIKNKTDQKEIF